MTEWSTLEIDVATDTAAADLLFASSHREALSDLVQGAVKRTGFSYELGRWLDLIGSGATRRILLLGIGPGVTSDAQRSIVVGGHLFDAMASQRIPSLRIHEADVAEKGLSLEGILLGALLRGFQLTGVRQKTAAAFIPERLIIGEAGRAIAERAVQTATAVNRARAWAEQPANLLTPPVWIEEVQAAFARSHASVRVLETKQLEQMGAGALLAVGRGSEHGARLLAVEWRGDSTREEWDAVMIGKGLTFDSGGLNLKSRPNIAKMKFDMAGGAAVLGALELAIARKSRANVVALVPVVENAIDALSFRPGDVLTSLSGLTIEVVDTDAEGRLVLADAITYAIQTYKPGWIVDTATLTGVVMAVLHEEFAALYASDDRLARELMQAGEVVGERLWRMPLDPSQDYLVESEIADVCNLGKPGFYGNAAGSPTAGAKFLEKFARGTRWAHIDLNGPAWSTRQSVPFGKGATGYGVRLLDRWLTILEAKKLE